MKKHGKNNGGEEDERECVLYPPGYYSSRKEWERASWNIIVHLPNILNALTTPYERHGIVLRAAIVDGIHLGKRYRRIGDELWCSPQTISTMKKALIEKKYRSYRERGKTERKKKKYSSFLHESRCEPHMKIVDIPWTGMSATRRRDTRRKR